MRAAAFSAHVNLKQVPRGPQRLKLYLVRHGETVGNQERRYVGWEDLSLTARGEQQAQSVARRLAGEPIRAVYSSDLQRAYATAAPIAAAHGLSVVTDQRLREANFGAWSGLTYDEIAHLAPALLHTWLTDPEQHAPPGGERLGDLRTRLFAALPRIDGAVVVSHGGPLRVLLSHWTGQPFWAMQVPLASLTIVEWDGRLPTMVPTTRITTYSHGNEDCPDD